MSKTHTAKIMRSLDTAVWRCDKHSCQQIGIVVGNWAKDSSALRLRR